MLHSKITPTTRIKVVFAWEPAVDDGGPRRELFSGKSFIVANMVPVKNCYH